MEKYFYSISLFLLGVIILYMRIFKAEVYKNYTTLGFYYIAHIFGFFCIGASLWMLFN